MAQKTKSIRTTHKEGQERLRGKTPSISWWDRLPSRTQHIICIGLLVVVSFGFFAPLHFSGKKLVPSDVVGWRAMAQTLIESAEQTGHTPLWAPAAFGGMPAYMILYNNAVPQLDSLPRLLRNVIWPSSHFIVLLLGAYLLVFFLTKDKLAGMMSAVAYGLTTYIPVVLLAGHDTKFMALCYAPWLILAFVYALKKPGLLPGLLFAAALAVNLRAGHVQITYYVVFLLGVWWIVDLIKNIRSKTLGVFAASTGWLALGGVLAVLMVAQPYLVNYEYKKYTIRGGGDSVLGGGTDWDYAMNWSQGKAELVTLAIADAFGGGGGTYWGAKPGTAGPHYVGGIILVLAIVALWKYRKYAVWAVGTAAFLMILFSLGSNLAWLNRLMFDYFPLFSAFRVPETWLSIVALALAVLAGWGLTYLTRDQEGEHAEGKLRTTYVTFGAALGIVLILLVGKSSFFAFEPENEYQQLIQQVVSQQPNVSAEDPQLQGFVRQEIERRKAQRIDSYTTDALRTLVFLALAGLVIVLRRRNVVPAWAAQAAIVLLVTIDLWGVGRRYLNEEALVDQNVAEMPVPKYDFDQYLIDQEQKLGEGSFRVLSLEGHPMVTARPSFYYQSLGGYHGAKLQLYQDFLEHMLFDPSTGVPRQHALDLMNTRYVVARGTIPGMPVVYQSPQTGFVVMENPRALPRAFFVGQTQVVSEPEATWNMLLSPGFNPATTAILPEETDFKTTPIDSGSVAEVKLQRYAPEEITWIVNTDAPRLLVVSEVYYPAGWTAEIDGKPTPIYRADYLLRAVPVPAGQHTVVMRFEPEMHRLGVLLSAIATVLVYGGICVVVGISFWKGKNVHHESI